MKITTEAIVLHLSKYSDKAAIVHTYTRKYGRMTYMLYGISGKKRSQLLSATEPFSLVEIEATHNLGREIQTLNNVSLSYVKKSAGDFNKRAVSMFIAEILYRTLSHPEPDEVLFDYLSDTLKGLDFTEDIENFHLRFLLQYTYFLGIMPSLDEYGKMLDITTGLLINEQNIDNCFTVKETELLIMLLNNKKVNISRVERQSLLNKLCMYYECHLTDFIKPKSLDVLKEVFDS